MELTTLRYLRIKPKLRKVKRDIKKLLAEIRELKKENYFKNIERLK